MPISDLLAQISGGKGGEPSTSRPSNASVKRKASSDLHSNATKTQRVTPPPLSRSISAARTSTDKASSAGQRYTGTASGRPSASTTSRVTPLSSRPKPASSSTSSPAAAAPTRSAPKKGSFAEILARGKAAQVTMGQVGKIQHKKVEGAAKRSKEELLEAAAAAQQVRGKKPASAPGYGGTSRPLQRPAGGSSSNGRANGAISKRPGATSSSLSKQKRPSAAGPGRKAPLIEPEKKMKKAAVATTGYAGTARPNPESETSSKKRHDVAPRGGALLSAPKHRSHGAGKFDDEYDEEMDDFIDYDGEDDDEPRYGYASDASSDMEAGMDDIYDEEDRAARIARQEDVREQELEKTLKAAKEERRRRALGYR